MDEQKEATPVTEETQPAPVETIPLTDYKKLEESYKGIQRKLTAKDREILELRNKAVTPDHLKALEDKFFSALEVMAPEDEEEHPVSRRERLRQLREVKPAPTPQPQEQKVAPEVQALALQGVRLLKKLGISEGTTDYQEVIDDFDNDPKGVIEKLEAKWEKTVAQRALETDRLETAQKQKASGVTKGDGAPSAGQKESAKPGDWQRLHSEAKTPQELIKKYKDTYA